MAQSNTTTDPTLPTPPAEVPEIVPLMTGAQFVLYPFMIAPIVVQDESVIRMIDDVVRGTRVVGIFAEKPESGKGSSSEDSGGSSGAEKSEGNGGKSSSGESSESKATFFDKIYDVGCVAMILKMLKIPDGTVRLLVHGMRRTRLVESLGEDPWPRARIEPIEDIVQDDNEMQALKKTARDMLSRLVDQSSLPNDLVVAANNMEEPGRLADLIGGNLSLSIHEQQQILAIADVKKRLLRIQEILARELEIAKIGSRIQSQVKSKMDEHQRDFVLREQMKAIRRELGEEQDSSVELDQILEQLKAAKLPEEAMTVATKELSRLRAMSPASAEYTVSRTYLDWIVALPWSKETKDNIDLHRARKVLDKDHYDLEKVKERILEYLAVIKLRKTLRGPLLCLVGPPGVGKTSLGRSVARAMGRKFVRISLGGVRDEAEIRGHRRTYIGSLPGRIIKSLKDAATRNPVFMLDEIDKLGMDFRGDPASALLEVLDPEQNSTFTDHYMDLAFDLSNVMFITTANATETIPGPLLDRMEVLRLSGYTMREKVKIGRQYLIPRALENTGLRPDQIEFTDAGLETIIEDYTREAGLRNLEREITNICRKVARQVAEGMGRKAKTESKASPKSKSKTIAKTKTATKEENKALAKVEVTAAHVHKVLGPPRFDRDELAGRTRQPGVALGLAWTPTGGEILFIEVTSTPGDGRLTLTGQLGDVMKESVQAALTYLHANAKRAGIPERAFKKQNLHVHVPAGAIPKDGPSAGIAMLTALASLLRNRPIREHLAMTGEVTLKGAVLPIGGIKEKILAAHRGGIEMVIMPRRNEKDLVDVPEEVRKKLDFHFVDDAQEVLKLAFPPAPRATHRKDRNESGGNGAAKTKKARVVKTGAGRSRSNGQAAPQRQAAIGAAKQARLRAGKGGRA